MPNNMNQDGQDAEDIGPVLPPKDEGTKDAHNKARRHIVSTLLYIVILTIVMPFALTLFGICLTEKHWEFLHIIFPAEIGILGAAMAFYFDRRD